MIDRADYIASARSASELVERMRTAMLDFDGRGMARMSADTTVPLSSLYTFRNGRTQAPKAPQLDAMLSYLAPGYGVTIRPLAA